MNDNNPTLTNKKLLIVDDEPQLLTMLEQILYTDGFFQLYTAKTCKEALNIMEKQSISLCILDINLPDNDGFFCFGKSVNSRRYPLSS